VPSDRPFFQKRSKIASSRDRASVACAKGSVARCRGNWEPGEPSTAKRMTNCSVALESLAARQLPRLAGIARRRRASSGSGTRDVFLRSWCLSCARAAPAPRSELLARFFYGDDEEESGAQEKKRRETRDLIEPTFCYSKLWTEKPVDALIFVCNKPHGFVNIFHTISAELRRWSKPVFYEITSYHFSENLPPFFTSTTAPSSDLQTLMSCDERNTFNSDTHFTLYIDSTFQQVCAKMYSCTLFCNGARRSTRALLCWVRYRPRRCSLLQTEINQSGMFASNRLQTDKVLSYLFWKTHSNFHCFLVRVPCYWQEAGWWLQMVAGITRKNGIESLIGITI